MEVVVTLKMMTPYSLANCSPFLAIRCLNHLAESNQDELPLASNILMNSTYIGDIRCRDDEMENAQRKVEELIELLHRGEFEIQK
ncbi:hypothetical protein WA026_022868 [Henosepilachna vigintioctopunctata]|uniref:Uncharacterized protein n=1 Tax=Henosepilachna vigintioctopunctata TaxID=420089 RepID=A0AAW1U4G0_9CUCU